MAIPSLGLAMFVFRKIDDQIQHVIFRIFFPRYVVTRHFWTDEQRRTFWLKNIAAAQYRYFKPIVDNLPKKPHLPVPLSRVSEVEILPIDRLPISAWVCVFVEKYMTKERLTFSFHLLECINVGLH